MSSVVKKSFFVLWSKGLPVGGGHGRLITPMPSPIAHFTVGYALYRFLKNRLGAASLVSFGGARGLLILILLFSVLADFDVAGGFEYHNKITHSLIMCVSAGILGAAVGWILRRGHIRAWFLVTVSTYALHLFLDFLTWGRGMALFWPFSRTRYPSPVFLFYGVRWSSREMFIVEHLITIATEAVFAVVILWLVRRLSRNSPESGSL